MKVAINKKVTKDLVDKISEILGCETEAVYMQYCTPVDAELKKIDIVLTCKQGEKLEYGALFTRPTNVTNDQITAMVVALGVSSGRWTNLENVWRTYVETFRKVASKNDERSIELKAMLLSLRVRRDLVEVVVNADRENASKLEGEFQKILDRPVRVECVDSCRPKFYKCTPDLVMLLPSDTCPYVTVYMAADWITAEQLKRMAEALGSTDGVYECQFDEWAKMILTDTSEQNFSYLLG